MHYSQSLNPNDRENQVKTLQMGHKSRIKDPKDSLNIKSNDHVLVPRQPNGQLSNGKRLIRKKEHWEDKIGMGQITPDESFKVKETQKIRRDYLKELMLNEVGKNGLKFRAKFLNRHKVSSEVRVRMVNYS